MWVYGCIERERKRDTSCAVTLNQAHARMSVGCNKVGGAFCATHEAAHEKAS